MIFAKRVFLIAGIHGLVVGVAVAWQLVFFISSRDPVRYRPVVLAAIVPHAD